MKNLILIIILTLTSCSKENNQTPTVETISHKERIGEYWEWYHQTSNNIYDGNGEWGTAYYGYRDVLRNTYWRGESYGMMAISNLPEANAYQQRASEAINFLLKAQQYGGTNVFGVPNEPNHPEFGTLIQQVNSTFPSGISNGWISDLPTTDMPELYYDHGYALAFLSREYSRSGNSVLLPSIDSASNWILNHHVASNNENYHSAVSKGLCYAFIATGNTDYLNKAIDIHQNIIFPTQQPDGKWDDEHNRRLVYHSFIISGLIALKKVMPNGDIVESELNSVLDNALQALVNEINASDMQSFKGTVEGWPGSCIITFVELAEYRPISDSEKQALEKVAEYLISNREYIEANLTSIEAAILLRLSAPIGMYASMLME